MGLVAVPLRPLRGLQETRVATRGMHRCTHQIHTETQRRTQINTETHRHTQRDAQVHTSAFELSQGWSHRTNGCLRWVWWRVGREESPRI